MSSGSDDDATDDGRITDIYSHKRIRRSEGDDEVKCDVSTCANNDNDKSIKRQKVSGSPPLLANKECNATGRRTSVAVLEHIESEVVTVVSLRGNFWKTMGHNKPGGINLLYIEEALYLLEKHQLLINNKNSELIMSDDETCERMGANDGDDSNEKVLPTPIPMREFYELVIKSISLECYLTYVKLKSLDYVVTRSGLQVRSFGEENDIIASFREYLKHYRLQNERTDCDDYQEPNLLDYMSSFNIYLVGNNYSKRNAAAGICKPIAHVIITLYSSKLLLTLIKQCGDIPCIFAVVMLHSGFVMLEELTNAEQSLKWDFGKMEKAGDHISNCKLSNSCDEVKENKSVTLEGGVEQGDNYQQEKITHNGYHT